MHQRSPEDGGVVLVVDDDDAIRRALRREMSRLGFSVVALESGRAALALGDETVASLSLVLLDYYMPGMDGLTLAQRLRAWVPRVPIALVTAGHVRGDERVRRALEEGVLDAVIEKPWRRGELYSLVERLVTGASPG